MVNSEMSVGDIAFIAYVKHLVPFHPGSDTNFPGTHSRATCFLLNCPSCKNKMPATTRCGVCDLCLKEMNKEWLRGESNNADK